MPPDEAWSTIADDDGIVGHYHSVHSQRYESTGVHGGQLITCGKSVFRCLKAIDESLVHPYGLHESVSLWAALAPTDSPCGYIRVAITKFANIFVDTRKPRPMICQSMIPRPEERESHIPDTRETSAEEATASGRSDFFEIDSSRKRKLPFPDDTMRSKIPRPNSEHTSPAAPASRSDPYAKPRKLEWWEKRDDPRPSPLRYELILG